MDLTNIFAVDENNVGKSNHWYNFTEAHKIFNIPNVGRNKLLEKLRQLEILRDNNWYSDDYCDLEHMFKMASRFDTPLITIEGIEYLKKKFPNDL